MGYKVRLQKIERPTNRSYYVTLPIVLAETMGYEKGDVLEWSIKDMTTLLLSKSSAGKAAEDKPAKPKVKKKK